MSFMFVLATASFFTCLLFVFQVSVLFCLVVSAGTIDSVERRRLQNDLCESRGLENTSKTAEQIWSYVNATNIGL